MRVNDCGGNRRPGQGQCGPPGDDCFACASSTAVTWAISSTRFRPCGLSAARRFTWETGTGPGVDGLQRLLASIEPLLRSQDFVPSVTVLPKSEYPESPFIDFSTFRNGGYKLGDTIYERQRRWVRAKADISRPWLEVPEPLSTLRRSSSTGPRRWEGWFFPWKEILESLAAKTPLYRPAARARGVLQGVRAC